MVSVARIIPQNNPRRKEPPHYHLMVMALLQVRFGMLVKTIFFLSWIISLLIGFPVHIGWIWWLLPVRSIPILIAGFLVLVLRKNNLHIEVSKYPSLILELLNRFTKRKGFIEAFILYGFSSFLYFWLIKYNMKDIGITTTALNTGKYELPRLNERYLYVNLYCFYIVLGYSVLHIVLDYDYLRFSPIGTSTNITPYHRARGKAWDVVLRSGLFALATSINFPIIYWLFRGVIWRNGLFFVKYVLLFKLHRSGEYVSFPVGIELFLITLFGSFFLFLLWEACNVGFSIYMSLGPVHRGVLISSKSPDPNGTLITGLKSTGRPLTRVLAFQELAYISLHDRVRRASIYSDIDRPIDQFGPPPSPTATVSINRSNTSAWNEIYLECKLIAEDLTKKLTVAISEKDKSKSTTSSSLPTSSAKLHDNRQSGTTSHTSSATSPPSITLKRDTNIFLNPNSSSNANANSTNALRSRIVDNLQDKEAHRSKEVISAINEARSTLHSFFAQYKSLIVSFLATKPGTCFRYTLKRQTNALVPNVALCNNALIALSYLVCFSIDEDTLGTVQRYIPDILTTYHNLIQALETYIANPPIHWSNPSSTRTQEYITSSTRRVRDVLEAAEPAFELIVVRFRPYLTSMSLPNAVQKRALQTAAESDIAF